MSLGQNGLIFSYKYTSRSRDMPKGTITEGIDDDDIVCLPLIVIAVSVDSEGAVLAGRCLVFP